MSVRNIAIIGTGFRFGPLYVCDIMYNQGLSGSRITLWDTDQETLALVFRYARIVEQRAPYDVSVVKGTSLQHTLQGQDFVILAIAVGGLAMMGREIALAERYGIRHTVGDTVGPAGISRAIRHIPVVLDIVKQMTAICPSATLIYTANPLTILGMLVSGYSGIRAFGVCQEPLHVIKAICRLFHFDPDVTRVDYDVWGINHFSFFTRLAINGIAFEDLWRPASRLRHQTRFVSEVLSAIDGVASEVVPVLQQLAAIYEYTHGNSADIKPFREQILPLLLSFYNYERTGVLPASRPRHYVEFLPDYLNPGSDWGKKYGVFTTTVASRVFFKEQQRLRIADVVAGKRVSFHVSNRTLIPIVSALANGMRFHYPINCSNPVAYSGLVTDAITEYTPCRNAEMDECSVPCEPPLNGALLQTINQCTSNNLDLLQGVVYDDDRLILSALRQDPLAQNADDLEELYLGIKMLGSSNQDG